MGSLQVTGEGCVPRHWEEGSEMGLKGFCCWLGHRFAHPITRDVATWVRDGLGFSPRICNKTSVEHMIQRFCTCSRWHRDEF